MSVKDAMRPIVKTAAASTVVSAYNQVFANPPKRILLMPSSTMYDYDRISQAFPDSEYWALERDAEIAREIADSGKFDRTIQTELRKSHKWLQGHTFNLAYLDLQGGVTYDNLMAIAETVTGRIPAEGMLLATTFLQRPHRTGRLRDYCSAHMSTTRFSQHFKKALEQETGHNLWVKKISDFGYNSGYNTRQRFVLSTYYVNTYREGFAVGTPWNPKKRLAAWNVKKPPI